MEYCNIIREWTDDNLKMSDAGILYLICIDLRFITNKD